MKQVKNFNLNRVARIFLSVVLLATSIPGPLASAQQTSTPNDDQTKAEPALSDREARDFVAEIDMTYWARLDHNMPWLTEAVLGGSPTENIPVITGAITDQDPYFMRSQGWQEGSDSFCEKGPICFMKKDGALLVTLGGSSKTLRLNQALAPVLETEEYLILTADTTEMFQAKSPGEAQPGEGFFFINKTHMVNLGEKKAPVPVFFFALPGTGWTGRNDRSMDLEITEQIALIDHSNVGLRVDVSDIHLLERVQLNNLALAQAASILEGDVPANNFPLPKANFTMAFGLVLSGLMPKIRGLEASHSAKSKVFSRIANQAKELILPAAEAETNKPSRLQRLRASFAATAKKWRTPAILYGAFGGLAAAAYDPDLMANMIPENFGSLVSKVGIMMAGVIGTCILLKYTFHKDYFNKKYPKEEGESIWTRLNKEHKGIMDELAHGLYFSVASFPQGIRHVLEVMKDRSLPTNRLVHKAWDLTFGYQMRQNTHLAMNWKTQYLGWLHGFLDSSMVAVNFFILLPWMAHNWGIGAAFGVASAAFASSEVLRNFLSYFQSAGHNYSAEVKGIHMLPSLREAKRKMMAMNLNPDSALNEAKLKDMTEAELAKIYKTVGLPDLSEFMYDPITALEWVIGKLGYSLSHLSQEQKAELADKVFVLKGRRWGLVMPALKRALKVAERAQAENPTATGAQTIQLLKWAMDEKSLTNAIAIQGWDTVSTRWGFDGLKNSISTELDKAESIRNIYRDALELADTPEEYEIIRKIQKREKGAQSAIRALIRGSLNHLVKDSTQKARDIRHVFYLGSATQPISDVTPFLPESWVKQAGSPEAARAGAEIFRHAFISLFEGKPEQLQPVVEAQSEYLGRATRIVDRLASSDPSMNDSFLRKLRVEQTAQRLQEITESRLAVINYQPKEIKGLAKKQWDIARQEAEEYMAAHPVDSVVEEAWNKMASAYNGNFNQEDQVEPTPWMSASRYRLVVAQQMARQVGLEVSNPEDSELVRKVTVTASVKVESELNLPRNRNYMDKLSKPDRDFYEAQLFFSHFISAYIDLTVRNEDAKAESKEYPGYFQKVRRWAVNSKGGGIVSAGVRGLEAIFRNEDSSYEPGWLSWVNRNIPILPDLGHNFLRTARLLPYLYSIYYLTNYYIWQIQTPYSLILATGALLFIHPSLTEFNNRLMKNYNIQVMKNAATKATYSFTHSQLTNIEPTVLGLYADSIQGAYDRNIVTPLKEFGASCEQFLTGRR